MVLTFMLSKCLVGRESLFSGNAYVSEFHLAKFVRLGRQTVSSEQISSPLVIVVPIKSAGNISNSLSFTHKESKLQDNQPI
jgi:hypothetical protein